MFQFKRIILVVRVTIIPIQSYISMWLVENHHGTKDGDKIHHKRINKTCSILTFYCKYKLDMLLSQNQKKKQQQFDYGIVSQIFATDKEQELLENDNE